VEVLAMRYVVRQGNKETVCEFRGVVETDRGAMLKMRPIKGKKDFLASPQDVSTEQQRQRNPSPTGDQEMNTRRNNPYGTFKDGRYGFWVRELKKGEKSSKEAVLKDGRRVVLVREIEQELEDQDWVQDLEDEWDSKIQRGGRRNNPYGVLKDGRPVLYVKEYHPSEVWMDGDTVIRPKNTGDILTELTGYPIRWFQGIGFVILSGLSKILPKGVVTKVNKKMESATYQKLDADEKVQDVYALIKDELAKRLKDERKDKFAKGVWATTKKEEKDLFYRDFFGEALAGRNTTEAIERMGYHISLRNRMILKGRLGEFLREHPEVIEQLAQGGRIGPDTLSDIEQHAYKLGYADVQVKKDARNRAQVELVKPRYQELDRDLREIIPYIAPQQPPRANNPYISFMAPRSGTDGGTQHRERGYVDFGSNTYTPIAGSKWFEEGTRFDFADNVDSSRNLLKAASLLAFAESSMSPKAKMEANRQFFEFVQRGGASMTNKEFTEFIAYLAQNSEGLIQGKASKLKKSAKWEEVEGDPVTILSSVGSKAKTPRVKKAVEKAVEAVEAVEAATSVVAQAAQEVTKAKRKVKQAVEVAEKAQEEAIKAEEKAENAPTPQNEAKATEKKTRAKKAKKVVEEIKQEVKEAVADLQEAKQEAIEAKAEAVEAVEKAAEVIEASEPALIAQVPALEAVAQQVETSTDAMLAASLGGGGASAPISASEAMALADAEAKAKTAARFKKKSPATPLSPITPTVYAPPEPQKSQEEIDREMFAALGL